MFDAHRDATLTAQPNEWIHHLRVLKTSLDLERDIIGREREVFTSVLLG
jgi:hypothetical protein